MEQSPLNIYKTHHQLGIGPAGRVQLVSRKTYRQYQYDKEGKQTYNSDQGLYAKKCIQYLPNHPKREILYEVQKLRSVNHPHLAKLYQFYDQDQTNYYFINEYCNQGNIKQIILQQKRFQAKLNIIAMIGSGLQFLHSLNIPHKSLKPENILLKNGIIKLSDYGIASKLLQMYAVKQTKKNKDYYFPQKIIDPSYIQLDIWAFGIICLQILTNKTIKMMLEENQQFPDFYIKKIPSGNLKIRQLIQSLLKASSQSQSQLSFNSALSTFQQYYFGQGYRKEGSNKSITFLKKLNSHYDQKNKIFVDYYEGEIKEGMKRGTGIYYHNHIRFQTNFSSQIGQGILCFRNGERYEGDPIVITKNPKKANFYDKYGNLYKGQINSGEIHFQNLKKSAQVVQKIKDFYKTFERNFYQDQKYFQLSIQEKQKLLIQFALKNNVKDINQWMKSGLFQYFFPKKLGELKSVNFKQKNVDISLLQCLPLLTDLNLEMNNIKDLKILKKLTFLTTLNLSSNKIFDIRPITNLISLTELDLSNNKIISTYSLRKLINLKSLNLYNNKIHEFESLNLLPNLTTLNFGKNGLQNISQLQKLTSLTTLDLISNQILDISPLKKLTNLEKLILTNNKIQDPSPLASLTSLITIDIRINPLSIQKTSQSGKMFFQIFPPNKFRALQSPFSLTKRQ